jgi:glucose-1-phosphate cytidylyltransferase
MKAVILAGGRGTRIAEESFARPKPMINIGDRPILWHVMTIYAAHGITEFIICLGYKGYMIKEFFAHYLLHAAESVTFDLATNGVQMAAAATEPWRVTVVETGLDTMTGGRIKRIEPWVRDDEAFCLTYGDGLANVDVTALIAHHRKCGRIATMTTVNPPGRFGAVELKGGDVTRFVEKPTVGEQVINGGFFVLSPKVFDYIEGDATVWEHEPLQTLAAEQQLNAFQHSGFWQPMDTVREREILEGLLESGQCPWLAADAR